MVEKLFLLLYDIVLVRLFYIFFLFLSFFNKKVKRGLVGRKNNQKLFEKLRDEVGTKKIIWFHSSSLGEFEQAKPIIEELQKKGRYSIIVSFFSPSGYENSINYSFVDLVFYLPLDFKSEIKKTIEELNPKLVVIMRYDYWPNFIAELHRKEIPICLVDATMRENSLRFLPVVKSFHQILFRKFERILTISNEDKKNFELFGVDSNKVKAIGDTRFDRVYQKSIVAKEKKLIPHFTDVIGGSFSPIVSRQVENGSQATSRFIGDRIIFVLGSTWEEDEEIMFPILDELFTSFKNLLVIIAPHEPTELHLERIETYFAGFEVEKKNQEESNKIVAKTIRFSKLSNSEEILSNNAVKIIIIDSIGILLSLYYYADLAFVGGGFKSSVHNVIEPATYGIPVLFGPKIHTSQEAQKIVKIGAGSIINSKIEGVNILRKMLSDAKLRNGMGKIAGDFVKDNTGATTKILGEISSIIGIRGNE